MHAIDPVAFVLEQDSNKHSESLGGLMEEDERKAAAADIPSIEVPVAAGKTKNAAGSSSSSWLLLAMSSCLAAFVMSCWSPAGL